MDALVGYTGFVGSNLALSHDFDFLFNSTNINESFALNPDLLVYAGIRGAKFLANNNPEDDKNQIEVAIENIKRINAKKIVLISTVDIYDCFPSDEDNLPSESNFGFYGENRLYLEKWIMKNISDYHIIRIPALYGDNLKKNFVYDLINIVPVMLRPEIYKNIAEDINIQEFYNFQDDGFYHFSCSDNDSFSSLRDKFLDYNFNALNFTDSRSQYQFYNLHWLWDHICKIIENNLRIMNICTEPISTETLYHEIYNKDFVNYINEKPIMYDVRTKYSKLICKQDDFPYLIDKNEILKDISFFIRQKIAQYRNAKVGNC